MRVCRNQGCGLCNCLTDHLVLVGRNFDKVLQLFARAACSGCQRPLLFNLPIEGDRIILQLIETDRKFRYREILVQPVRLRHDPNGIAQMKGFL